MLLFIDKYFNMILSVVNSQDLLLVSNIFIMSKSYENRPFFIGDPVGSIVVYIEPRFSKISQPSNQDFVKSLIDNVINI